MEANRNHYAKAAFDYGWNQMNNQITGIEILVVMVAICIACFVFGFLTGRFLKEKPKDKEE